MEKSYKNNKFKISTPTWTEEFKLPDELYSVLDIQDFYNSILKKHEKIIDNHSIIIYVNKIENRITFRINKLLMPETMTLPRSTKSKINKDKMVKMCII